MKSEEKIKELYEGMEKHKHYIKDDFHRFGYDNFMSALWWVLQE